MKKIILQMSVIFLFSAAVGIVYNQFSRSPLPIFKKYNPLRIDNSSAKNPGADDSILLQEIDIETMRYMLETDEVVLVDARTKEEFNDGHIPGAVNLPVYEFPRYYQEAADRFGNDRIIVTYCSSITCVDSSLLAEKLYRKGHTQIFVYRGGFDEWSNLGLPVERPGEDAE